MVVVVPAPVVNGIEDTLGGQRGGQLLEHPLQVRRPRLAGTDVHDEPLSHW